MKVILNPMKNLILLVCLFSFQTLIGQELPEKTIPAKVLHESIVSNYLETKVDYHIYLPNTYKLDSTNNFPVVYWLHGSGGWPPGVINMLANRFHLAIKKEKIPPTIVVFLDDGKRESMWVDWKDGSVKMESVIIRELIPHIDQTFRTIAHAKGRILEGGSMGGYGTARFGFKYPELFTAISMLNPGPMQEVLVPEEVPLVGREKAQIILDKVYGGDIEYFRTLSPWQITSNNASKIRGTVDIRIILGGTDPSLQNNKKFSTHLNNLKIKHTVRILENAGHSPKAIFGALQDDYWEFFRHNLSKSRE